MAITRYTYRKPAYAGWGDLSEVSNRLARFFDATPSVSGTAAAGWAPRVNVTETSDELLLTAEVPGLTEEDLKIDLENNVLSISGQKTETRTEGDEELRYHVWERSYGSFSRSFTLPRTVTGDDITARFENGILTVHLPKSPEAKGRKIEISKS